jgi:aminopeptidase N
MQSVRRLITTFVPEHYSLSLDINRAERTFHGLVTVEGAAVADEPLRLHAKDLGIVQVTVDGREAAFRSDSNDELIIEPSTPGKGKHVVVIEFSGLITDQMHGMYPCYFTHDGELKELIATQFESHHAREVFPCIDEPEAKATFDISLTTELGVTVLGNMPAKSQRREDGRLVTTFERTPRMSVYLLAWVYGDLQKRSAATRRGVEVNVWATPVHAPESLDFALDFAVKTIDYFEDYFGVDYPLPKSDHVALPDFTSGAMENWGLITYREIALLADPATATVDSKHYVAMVVGHELSHQWFGNLVTMKWWDNLWLNESFANFIENLPIAAMHPVWGIWMDYASTWSLMAMRRDAIDGVQPVQTEVHHPDEITSLFDGAIVYGKGGRLIGMLREYVGEADFRKGLKLYFTKFAYQNTSGEDLWDCLEEASSKPVRDFMNQWVLRSGYPIVHVAPGGLRQERFFIGEHQPSDRLWPIPLAAEPGRGLPDVFDTKELKADVAPEVRLNVGNWSHFITHYAQEHFAGLLERIQEFEPLDRLQLINERVLLTRSGHVSNASLIPLLESSATETHESVWGILNLGLGELKKFVEFDEKARSSLKQLARQVAEPQFRRLGWQAGKAEPENDLKLRPTILALELYGDDEAVLAEAVKRYAQAKSIEALDPELRSIILAGWVKAGLDSSKLDSLVKAYSATASSVIREDIMGALCVTEDETQLQRLLNLIPDGSIVRPQDASHWYVNIVRSRVGEPLAWQWLQANWSWIEKTYGGDKSYDDFVRYTAGALSTRQQLQEFRAFFAPLKQQPALKRVIELGTAEIKARVEIIERDQTAVVKALLDNQ